MTMMMTAIVAQTEGTPAPGGPFGNMGMMLPILLMIGVFYFMMIRPQQRKDKERRKQIEEMKAGTRVLFSGGIIGRIREKKEGTFMVEVANGVILEIAQGAVNRVLQDGEAAVVEEK